MMLDLATRATLRLAGRTGFKESDPPPSLPDEYIAMILTRVADAKSISQLTMKEFLRLRGSALRAFAGRHSLNPLEVRWAQRVAGLLWGMAGVAKTARRLGRLQQRRRFN